MPKTVQNLQGLYCRMASIRSEIGENMKKVAKNANVDVAEHNKEWVLSNPNECPF